MFFLNYKGSFIEKDTFKRKHETTDDLINAIRIGHQQSNDFRNKILNLPPITVEVLEIPDVQSKCKETSKEMSIVNIRSYYNLQNVVDETDISGQHFLLV